MTGPRGSTAKTLARITWWARLSAQVLLASVVVVCTLVASALTVASWLVETYPSDNNDAWFHGIYAMFTTVPALLLALIAKATNLLSWWWLLIPLTPFTVAWIRLGLL